MLSSFAGIFGNYTQSNYAAGCAFQDALAQERRARGLPCSVSIDLGIMRGAGYFAEEGAVGPLKQWEERFGMDETELHSLLRLAIGGEIPFQVVTGLPHGSRRCGHWYPTAIILGRPEIFPPCRLAPRWR